MKREHLRPLVHAGVLGFVFLEPVLGRWGMAGAAFAAFLVNALVLPHTAIGKALRREGDPWFNGQLSYPTAVALAYLLFPPPIAALSWAVMALGDPAAAVVGSARNWEARLPWNRRKSVMGTFAFIVVAKLSGVCVLGSSFGVPSPHDSWISALAISGVVAVVAALVESIPLPIDDNLPVVLSAGAVAYYLVPALG